MTRHFCPRYFDIHLVINLRLVSMIISYPDTYDT
jgi:hypothetical protein